VLICISLIVLLLAETIGIWFLNNKLTIPYDRIVAANWVFQFSVFTLILTILSVPYYALKKEEAEKELRKII
jgi:hypothetical protein